MLSHARITSRAPKHLGGTYWASLCARVHRALACLGALASIGGLTPSLSQAQEQDMKVIVNFTEQDEARWSIVNDGVMGGRSSSDMELTDEGTALFSGNVSLENNGGFASVRATFPSLDLSPYTGVTLRVRGDGRLYQLRFRMDGSFDGVAHGSGFETVPGEWIEVELPFSAFQPTFR